MEQYVNTAHGVTTASTQATVVNSTTIDNLSDVVICAFFASSESVEARLLVYKKNESVYEEDIKTVDKCKIEEFVNESIVSESTVKKPVVESSEAKASADKSKTVRKNNSALIIED
ncbi:hypothetical protein Tco_0551676 [Tanacetum coccineum]